MSPTNSPQQQRGQVTAAWLSARMDDHSASGIASAVSQLIRTGDIASGSQLPTVRALAARLGVSPATVSAAWNALRRQRVIEGSGRKGIWVLDHPVLLAPQRFENVSRFWQGNILDLSLAAPDPDLLPDAINALKNAVSDPELNTYRRPSITPELQKAVESIWPWTPESWLTVNGGYEGLLLLASSNLVPGQSVAVADPTTPRILDILELAGVRIIPVASDDQGPVPDSLQRALEKKPIAFLYEPRAGAYSGASMSMTRRDALAGVLVNSTVLIIEDEGLGDLATASYAGLGSVFPKQTVLVRSYSKSHGPDLRIAVMGGAAEPLERARVYRQFGAGWTSRLLQNALAWMLTDPEVQASVQRARETYSIRRQKMTELLLDRGVVVDNNDGLAIWVPVRNEQQALLVLASHGVAAGGMEGGRIASGKMTIRLPIGNHLEHPEKIADLFAMASIAL